MNRLALVAGASFTPLVDVTVKVPAGTETAFRKVAEAWVEGVTTANRAPAVPHWTSTDELLQPATEWWASLNASERAIFSLWIDSAPALVPASRIVAELDLPSKASIRGIINRITRKAGAVGFQAGWQSDKVDPLTGERLYGVRAFGTGEYPYDQFQSTATEYAALLREARAAVDARAAKEVEDDNA